MFIKFIDWLFADKPRPDQKLTPRSIEQAAKRIEDAQKAIEHRRHHDMLIMLSKQFNIKGYMPWWLQRVLEPGPYDIGRLGIAIGEPVIAIICTMQQQPSRFKFHYTADEVEAHDDTETSEVDGSLSQSKPEELACGSFTVTDIKTGEIFSVSVSQYRAGYRNRSVRWHVTWPTQLSFLTSNERELLQAKVEEMYFHKYTRIHSIKAAPKRRAEREERQRLISIYCPE